MNKSQHQPRGICQIVGCSDGLAESRRTRIAELGAYLEELGYEVRVDENVFVPFGRTAPARERAKRLVSSLADPHTSLVLDVTGGDATSSLLRLLPSRIDNAGETMYWGISDNTTIHTILGRIAPDVVRVYWYPTNLVLDDRDIARARFETLLTTKAQPELDLTWIQGSELAGPIMGGNIRCLLKLAGTPYFPDLKGVVLLLESGSGELSRMEASMDQLRDIGVFTDIQGVILGDFAGLEGDGTTALISYVQALVDPSLTICQTEAVGHGTATIPVILGQHFSSKTTQTN